MFYYLSIVIIVISNIVYHLASKKVPQNTNPFFFVMISYIVGFFIAAIAFTISIGNKNLMEEVTIQSKLINWTPILLGISVIGLEVGNVLMYRAGWNISKGALFCNILLAVALIAIGVVFFKEEFNLKQVFGVVSCVIGLYLLK